MYIHALKEKRTSQEALLILATKLAMVMMIAVMDMIMMVRSPQTFPAFKLTAQCDFYLPLSQIVHTSSKCKLFTDA